MAGTEPKLRDVFSKAAECQTVGEQAAYVAQACEGNAAFRAQLEELLQAHRQVGSFLREPYSARAPTVSEARSTERTGTVIGPYKLLQQIGEGGMGTVFMAEQIYPVQRKVALKVIKAGMDSRQVVVRFEAERQALAMMDHVNIARVFDGGTTEKGQPYFVMELVHGVPITKYCDDNHLTPRERLELFVPVCQAIQHAHQKGIIHRDVKPSNVMITLYDGKPVPKVIDFGVAKATEQKLTERTLFTQYGTMVGTPLYMSPEQAEMSALGVDTRSDIFSLGVLLYELLTGSTPLSHKRVKEAAYAEVLRMIKEEEPPKPSTRLSDLGSPLAPREEGSNRVPGTLTLASIAAQRNMEPAKLTKLVQGELDWIVMKCLEKDRNRRYETANDFAADVQRYLDDDSVQACPPSASYRFRKFARRNKMALLTAGVVAAALLLGTAVSTWQAVRARDAEREANGQRDAAVVAERAAKESEADTEVFSKFLVEDVLAVARPKGQQGGLGIAVTVRQALDAAAPKIAETFVRRPRAEAKARAALGLTYVYVSDAPAAIAQLERAAELSRQQLGSDHVDTLSTTISLANAYRLAEKLDRAMPLLEETLKLQRSKLGPSHVSTLATMSILAVTYKDAGRQKEALLMLEETLRLQRAELGDDNENTLATLDSLAGAYKAAGRFDESLAHYEEAVKLQKIRLGPDHPHTLAFMANLAGAYKASGRLNEAIQTYEETLKRMQVTLGPDHHYVLGTMGNLGVTYRDGGRPQEGLLLLEETLKLQQAKLGHDHSYTIMTMRNLARIYAIVGREEDAVSLLENTLKLQEAKLEPNHPATLVTMGHLASAYQSVERLDEAAALLASTLKLQEAKLEPNHPSTLDTMSNLAGVYHDALRLSEAVALFEQTLKLQQAKLGGDHPSTIYTRYRLALTFDTAGQMDKALSLLEETVQLRRAKLGAEHPETLDTTADLGRSMLKVGKYAEAEPLLRACLASRERSKQPDAWATFDAKSLLGGCLLGQQKYADAEPLLLAAYEGMRQREGRVSRYSRVCRTEALERVAQLYDAWGKKDQAEEWRTKLKAREVDEKRADK